MSTETSPGDQRSEALDRILVGKFRIVMVFLSLYETRDFSVQKFATTAAVFTLIPSNLVHFSLISTSTCTSCVDNESPHSCAQHQSMSQKSILNSIAGLLSSPPSSNA